MATPNNTRGRKLRRSIFWKTADVLHQMSFLYSSFTLLPEWSNMELWKYLLRVWVSNWVAATKIPLKILQQSPLIWDKNANFLFLHQGSYLLCLWLLSHPHFMTSSHTTFNPIGPFAFAQISRVLSSVVSLHLLEAHLRLTWADLEASPPSAPQHLKKWVEYNYTLL